MDNRTNKMLIDATHPEETRVVVLRNGRVEEFDYESAARKLLRGNIYLAKVTRVEPSLQAAFVEYGGNRHGFLAFNEIHPDYYQIPMSDRQALIEEEAAAEAEAEAEADARAERRAQGARRRDGRNGHRQGRDGGQHVQDAHVVQPGDEQPYIGDTPNAGHSLAEATGHEQQPQVSELYEPAHPGADTHTQVEAGHGAHDHVGHGHADQDHGSHAPKSGHDSGLSHDHAHHDHSHDHSRGHADPEHVHDAAPATHHDAEYTQHGEAGSPHVHADHIEEVVDAGEAPETLGADVETETDEGAHADEGGEEEVRQRPRRQRRRQYKIQEVIKRRQVILVQVVKEERGNKGAALTTYLSLAGRYTVLMPNTGRGGGISRKIVNPGDRKRLKAIAQELDVQEGMGLIIRTAGAARTSQEIKRDYEYLLRLWESVRELTLQSTAPSLVYEEGNLIKRSIRDLYTKEIDEVVVAGDQAHEEAHAFMRMLMPSHAKNVTRYNQAEPLFARYPIERQLAAMFSPYVNLKSGGYLVINQTEALVSIDINSGKSTREFSIEETALATNLEAADEIARQLKLRDLAGLIVIDFIDMEEKRNNRSVERRLTDALRFDRARIQVGRISHFGLLEMSRQRMRTGMLEGSTSQCPHCQGSGMIRSTESVALAVLRGLDDHLVKDPRSSVNVLTTATVALYILNNKRSFIADVERRYGVQVQVQASERMQGANFAFERSTAPVLAHRPADRNAVSMDWGLDGEEASEQNAGPGSGHDSGHGAGHSAGHDIEYDAGGPAGGELEIIENGDDRDGHTRESHGRHGRDGHGGEHDGQSREGGRGKRRRRRGRDRHRGERNGQQQGGEAQNGNNFAEGGHAQGGDHQHGHHHGGEQHDQPDQHLGGDGQHVEGGGAGAEHHGDGREDGLSGDQGQNGGRRGRRRGRRGGRRGREHRADGQVQGEQQSGEQMSGEGGDAGPADMVEGDGRGHHDHGHPDHGHPDRGPHEHGSSGLARHEPAGHEAVHAHADAPAQPVTHAAPEAKPQPETVAATKPERAPAPVVAEPVVVKSEPIAVTVLPEAEVDPAKPAKRGWWSRK